LFKRISIKTHKTVQVKTVLIVWLATNKAVQMLSLKLSKRGANMSSNEPGKFNVSSRYKEYIIDLINESHNQLRNEFKYSNQNQWRDARKARNKYNEVIVEFKKNLFMELSGYETAEKNLERIKRFK